MSPEELAEIERDFDRLEDLTASHDGNCPPICAVVGDVCQDADRLIGEVTDQQRQRDSARRWVVNLESRIARAREIAAESVVQPGTRALLLAALDGEEEQ